MHLVGAARDRICWSMTTPGDRQALGIGGGWGGIERALREQMIKEGHLKPEDVAEATDLNGASIVKALETAGALPSPPRPARPP